jgi:hypothetical protein
LRGESVGHFCNLDDAEQEAISLAVAERVAASGAANLEELAAKEGKSRLVLWAEIAVRAMARMLERPALQVEVHGVDIVVTMPGTSFRAVYRKPHRATARATKLDSFQDQKEGPVTRVEFLARARKLANTKARELRWIV